jgi:hypothetical protein
MAMAGLEICDPMGRRDQETCAEHNGGMAVFGGRDQTS